MDSKQAKQNVNVAINDEEATDFMISSVVNCGSFKLASE